MSIIASSKRKQAGLSLIELIVFIVVVAIGVVGLLSVMNVTVGASADPMQRKQALAVAEAVMEEVSLMPFTECDSDTLPCLLEANSFGPEAGEQRGGITPFDHVNDYNGFRLAAGGGGFSNGALVVVPVGYRAEVAVVAEAAGLGPAGALVQPPNVVRISVTVFYNNDADNITIEGYRTRE